METNEKNNLTENTIVSFNINDAIKGIGIIKGIANRSLPVIGKSLYYRNFIFQRY